MKICSKWPLILDLGFPESLPFSSILYFFYNKDFFDNCAKKKINVQEYINNITFIAINKLVESNNQKLVKIYNQVYKNWKVKYRLKFSLLKYQLIYISKKQNNDYIAGIKLRRNHLI